MAYEQMRDEVRLQAGRPQVLVAGASFAGLTTAWWMHRLGYGVTVVEVSKGLRKGGSPVDIKEGTVEVVRRMGLLERIQAESLKPKGVEFLDSRGVPIARMPAASEVGEGAAPEYEIERNTLLGMLYDAVKADAEFLFDDRIAEIAQSADEVAVTFRSGRRGRYALLIGCDGNHSSVRRMVFGDESAYSHSLQTYGSITIADKLLIPEDTAQMYNVPGKTVTLSAYNGKTDIIFCFHSEEEIAYDYRDGEQQRAIVEEWFRGEGWRSAELLGEMRCADNFYFDRMSQVKMPCWTKGRVALAGDAAYCASPAAGMGGSLAIVGATALADAFAKFPGHYEAAFREYNVSLRPFAEHVQTQAVEFGLAMFVPRTEEALLERNAAFGMSGVRPEGA